MSCMRGGSLRPEGTGELLLAVGQQLRPPLSRGPLPFPCSDAQAQDSLQQRPYVPALLPGWGGIIS